MNIIIKKLVGDKNSYSTLFISVENIIRIKAIGAHVTIHMTDGKSVSYTKNIKQTLLHLDSPLLFRVHQSHAVNMNQIRTVNLNKRNGIVVMNDGEEIKVSYRKCKDFAYHCERYIKS